MIFSLTQRSPRVVSILICIVAIVLIIGRRSDAVLNPQFYAEDGRVWFAEAYHNGGWGSLLKTLSSILCNCPFH